MPPLPRSAGGVARQQLFARQHEHPNQHMHMHQENENVRPQEMMRIVRTRGERNPYGEGIPSAARRHLDVRPVVVRLVKLQPGAPGHDDQPPTCSHGVGLRVGGRRRSPPSWVEVSRAP
uniref:Uncharacterized protein n=1 Tax=Haptolina brevifila TaxID=156173 RepID=A0A7S2DV79_9EUKA|mmetsp:Transcript_44565/g.89023  ORF Transcript_44565/g.89023 Transcript_44565/m.89023 type:complete len:119 (+) Transcript_44565:41-397(+)